MAGYELDVKLLKDVFVQVAGGLTGGVVGAVVAGIFTTRGIKTQFNHQRDLQAIQEQKEISSILRALNTEISMFYKTYMETIGKAIEELDETTEEIWQCKFSVNTDFIIYRANADKLGRVNNDNLRALIILAYQAFEQLGDVFKQHLTEMDNYQKYSTLVAARPDLEYELQRHLTTVTLNALKPAIKARHNAAKKISTGLLALMEKELGGNSSVERA
jgi:hypothetical protein